MSSEIDLFFVRSFIEAVAEENRLCNIRIMLLCPGATETNFFDAANVGESALLGLGSSITVTISGFKNSMTAWMGYLVPNSFSTKTLANSFRSTFDRKR